MRGRSNRECCGGGVCRIVSCVYGEESFVGARYIVPLRIFEKLWFKHPITSARILMGTATSAHQVEGNNTNNQWWKWEQDGHTDGHPACLRLVGGRWREDFDRAAEGRQNAHRLSVEWSRISRLSIRGMKMLWSVSPHVARIARARHLPNGHAPSFHDPAGLPSMAAGKRRQLFLCSSAMFARRLMP